MSHAMMDDSPNDDNDAPVPSDAPRKRVDPDVTFDGDDGVKLQVHTEKFEPVDAYRVLAKLGRILIPAMVAAKKVTGNTKVVDLVPAVTKLFDQLTPELAESLMHEALAKTSVTRPDPHSGKMVNIQLIGTKNLNRAFSGQFRFMLLTIKHALMVNYADFFVESVGESDSSESSTPTQSD